MSTLEEEAFTLGYHLSFSSTTSPRIYGTKLYTPTQWHALTTYHSQLVLVGGRGATTWKTTNQVSSTPVLSTPAIVCIVWGFSARV